MCASCFTKIDAVALNSAGLIAMLAASRRRIVDGWRGRSASARRRDSYESTAAFLSALGHDPTFVLGPKPQADPVAPRA